MAQPSTAAPPQVATAAPAGGAGGCGSCCGGWLNHGGWVGGWFGGCGCDNGAPLGISAGGGFYYMMPYFSSNPGFFSSRPGSGTIHQSDANSQLTVAPTGYIAFALTPEWEIRARWWQINTDGNATAGGGATISDGGGRNLGTGSSPGATTNFNSNLYISMYNLEVGHKWLFGNGSWIEASGGFAYVHMSQSSELDVADPVLGNATSIANHNFNGFGPTAAFEGHYRLGCSDFFLYGSARMTLLFGSCDQNYFSTGPVGIAAGSSSALAILPVGELELGVEWAHKWGRFTLSAQLGVVGQIWFNGGDAVQGSNLSGTNLGGQASSPANFGFIGGVARGGISF